jgi:hypothetical protein
MYHIIYLSSASYLFSTAELQALLEQARVKNARLAITGILLYRDGNFMQLLEGEPAVVEALYQTILRDARHTGSIRVLDGEIAERAFPEWTMAYQDLSLRTESNLPGFNQFLNTPLTGAEFAQKPNQVRKLLNLFKQTLR